jgi:hypothetical protein
MRCPSLADIDLHGVAHLAATQGWYGNPKVLGHHSAPSAGQMADRNPGAASSSFASDVARFAAPVFDALQATALAWTPAAVVAGIFAAARSAAK